LNFSVFVLIKSTSDQLCISGRSFTQGQAGPKAQAGRVLTQRLNRMQGTSGKRSPLKGEDFTFAILNEMRQNPGIAGNCHDHH
jgi:hypothetical protein